VRPAHTLLDGDTIFALACGETECDLNILGVLAAELFAEAVQRAVKLAAPAGGLPALSENENFISTD
jgi:L-aminopeptidase/D-esterase-like protein